MNPSSVLMAQDGELDPVRMKQVEGMALIFPDDTLYEGMREQMGAENFDAMVKQIAKEEAERKEFIRHSPGITPYLFALLDREYSNHNAMYVSIMVAISMRSDLTEGNLNKLTDTMNEILDSPQDERKAYYQDEYLIGGVIILKKFPSLKNEEIAIRVLNRSGDSYQFPRKLAAADTLASIGTERSLAAMDEAQRWAESDPGIKGSSFGNEADRIKNHNKNFKRRLEGVRRVTPSIESDEHLTNKDDESVQRIPGDRYLHTIYWFLALLGGLGAVAIGIAFRRGRTNH